MQSPVDKISTFWQRNYQANIRLVVINVAFSLSVWLIGFIFKASETFIMVPDNFLALLKQPYALITYMFAHNSLWHLVGNIFIIYFIGSVFEDLLGSKKVYTTYFAAGIIGALGYILIVSKNSWLIGASGAAMGLLYGLTLLRPNYEFFLFGVLKIKLWWITAIYFASDILYILANHNLAGGNICHVFGGLTGMLLMAYWTDRINFRAIFNGKKQFTIHHTKQVPMNTPQQSAYGVPSQEEIDAILDKINESGYQNLTQSEKETLFRAKDIEV